MYHPDIKTLPQKHLHFICGGGEMGALIREKDWSKTPLGDPKNWPQSLRTMVSVMLNNPFAMYIAWGREYIQLYNDGYRPILGSLKHPVALGIGTQETFSEIWHTVQPMFDAVMEGESFNRPDFLFQLNRHGFTEDCYFDFAYSPIRKEDGQVGGVLVTVIETTNKKKAEDELKKSEQRFRDIVKQTPVSMVVLRGREFVVETVNNAYLLLVDKEENEFAGKPLFDSLPETEQGVRPLLEHVLDTGIPYHGIEYPVSIKRYGKLEVSYFDFLYHPLIERDNKISGIIVTVADVSSKVLVRTKLEEIAAIVHSSHDAIISKNLNGIVTSWNTAAERIFGYSADEMIGQPIIKLIPADRLSEEPDILGRLRKGQRVDHFETKRITKDKRILDISLTISPIRDSHGNVIGASKIARDITRQKQAERIIKESEEKFRLLADSMPQFIWTSDAEGNINYFNQAVYKYSSLTEEQLGTDGWLQIVHPDERNENIVAWQEAVTTGQDFIIEHRFRRYDGEYRWQLSRAVPQKDEAGNTKMWVGASTDIQAIKEQDQQKDYFISVASHELKTPITSIKAYTQILQSHYSESNDSFLTKSLAIIDRQVLKLTNLISDLLDLSKIKSGALTLSKENFQINDLIQEIIDEIKHVNPTYDIIFSKGAMTTVFADRERIGQVLTNLLTNAIKYSPDCLKIEVESLIEDNNLVVTIKDYGIGIGKHEQEKIFERFYRVEGKAEKKFPGFGIGLFISMEIIRGHNGIIGVNSEQRKGSEFYFSVPLITGT